MSNRKKEKNYCIDCGKEISIYGIRCPQCASISKRKIKRPSRNYLKYLIRNYSFTYISKLFGVSDNAIKKWCKSAKLPSSKKEVLCFSDEDWLKI